MLVAINHSFCYLSLSFVEPTSFCRYRTILEVVDWRTSRWGETSRLTCISAGSWVYLSTTVASQMVVCDPFRLTVLRAQHKQFTVFHIQSRPRNRSSRSIESIVCCLSRVDGEAKSRVDRSSRSHARVVESAEKTRRSQLSTCHRSETLRMGNR